MRKGKDSASIKDDRQAGDVTPDPKGKTGAGAEATEGMDGEARGESQTHRSGYGGDGGKPKRPNG